MGPDEPQPQADPQPDPVATVPIDADAEIEAAETSHPDSERESGPNLAEVGEQLSNLVREVASLRDRLGRVEPADQVGASLRQLTDQLEQNQRQEWRPMYLDLILLLDRVEQGLSAWPDDPQISEFVGTIRDEIGEILARRGVTPLELADTRFDPNRQRAVKVQPSDDPAEDRQVVAVVRRGYQCDGYLLRPEEVVVARYGYAEREG